MNGNAKGFCTRTPKDGRYPTHSPSSNRDFHCTNPPPFVFRTSAFDDIFIKRILKVVEFYVSYTAPCIFPLRNGSATDNRDWTAR